MVIFIHQWKMQQMFIEQVINRRINVTYTVKNDYLYLNYKYKQLNKLISKL